MSAIGSFDRTQHLGELLVPLFSNTGVLSPAARQAKVQANIGLTAAITAFLQSTGVGNTRLLNPTIFYQPAAVAVNTSATLTAAQMWGGLITSTTAAAVAATVPTGTAMDTAVLAAFPNYVVNDSFEMTMVNTGGTNALTLTAASGFTVVGAAAVAANTSGTFLVVRTATNTWIAYRK